MKKRNPGTTNEKPIHASQASRVRGLKNAQNPPMYRPGNFMKNLFLKKYGLKVNTLYLAKLDF